MWRCPLVGSCGKECSNARGLQLHWERVHSHLHGPLADFKPPCQVAVLAPPQDDVTADRSVAEAPGPSPAEDFLETAMRHCDAMKFQYYESDADVNRAKELLRDCLRNDVEPALAAAIPPNKRQDINMPAVMESIMAGLDRIGSAKGEHAERQKRLAQDFPPLRVYPRYLGLRPAVCGKRKCVEGEKAYAWDTNLEEVMERDFHFDPQLVTECIMADQYWTRRAGELRASGKYDPGRLFRDQCDGEVWQAHEVLGDPRYKGPTRLVLEGYSDSVDVPNPIGTAAGFSKLWCCFLILVNRPPGCRQTLRAINLATCCLQTDFDAFGPRALISGVGDTGNAIGETFRRMHYRGAALRTPPSLGFTSLFCRAYLSVWTADGLDMGAVGGTNTSFSKAINPCNSCEDLDSRSEDKRKPCSFLCCRCPETQKSHSPGCACHFRLRTPTRDRMLPKPLSKQLKQQLGITTEEHGLVDIPFVNRATLGPKETMHTFLEGRTKHLAAYTLWHIEKTGLATEYQIRTRASTFNWTPGGGKSGFFVPNYIPHKLFTSTKITLPTGKKIWAPHHDAKLPFSAMGMLTFTIMSIEFLRPFLPKPPYPPWLLAWVKHAHGVAMLMRYAFTFADLQVLEKLFLDSEQLIFEIPEYSHTWIAKAHWVLHAAHDIFRWGPTRLLMTLLKEMKNAVYKRGVKRSNFHNPVKSAVEFWAGQSDWQLRAYDPISRAACCSSYAKVIVSGPLSSFSDSTSAQLLLHYHKAGPETNLVFLNSVQFHGVTIRRTDHVLMSASIFFVARIICVGGTSCYLYLHHIPSELQRDDLGALFIDVVPSTSSRMLSLDSHTDITGVWTVMHANSSRMHLVIKY